MNATPNLTKGPETDHGSRGPLAVLLGAVLLLAAGIVGASLGSAVRGWVPAGVPLSASAPRSASVPATSALARASVASGTADAPLPRLLSETGLYESGSTTRIAPENRFYVPQYPLWTDGATKRRWIYLPEGTRIDASNPDSWQFPVGTRFWKEFSFHGKPVETRYIERVADGSYRFATYAWDHARGDAVLAPDAGIRDVAEIQGAVRHDVPSLGDCRACHEGRTIPVLGFGALQLSSDRDPLAPHRETVPEDALDLDELLRRELLASAPPELSARAPRIDAPSPTARAAAGYFFGNCSGCHNSEGSLSIVGLDFDQSVVGRGGYDGLIGSAAGQKSGFHLPGEDASVRIAPGDPRHSAVFFRMISRDAASQMPPLGTELVDTEAQALVRRFIAELVKQPARKEQP